MSLQLLDSTMLQLIATINCTTPADTVVRFDPTAAKGSPPVDCRVCGGRQGSQGDGGRHCGRDPDSGAAAGAGSRQGRAANGAPVVHN